MNKQIERVNALKTVNNIETYYVIIMSLLLGAFMLLGAVLSIIFLIRTWLWSIFILIILVIIFMCSYQRVLIRRYGFQENLWAYHSEGEEFYVDHANYYTQGKQEKTKDDRQTRRKSKKSKSK